MVIKHHHQVHHPLRGSELTSGLIKLSERRSSYPASRRKGTSFTSGASFGKRVPRRKRIPRGYLRLARRPPERRESSPSSRRKGALRAYLRLSAPSVLRVLPKEAALPEGNTEEGKKFSFWQKAARGEASRRKRKNFASFGKRACIDLRLRDPLESRS